MHSKYSNSCQEEIQSIIDYLKKWNRFFSIEIQYFIDGWSISLNELTLYPRYIVVAKFYNCECFNIKSFEVSLNESFEEEHKEIFSINQIKTKEKLFQEIRQIIYGKDLFSNVKNCLKKIKS